MSYEERSTREHNHFHDFIEELFEEAGAKDVRDYWWGAAAEAMWNKGWRIVKPERSGVEVTELHPDTLPDAAVLERADFVELLSDLRATIHSSDSLEGNLQYEAADVEGRYRVKGAYRIGNREGQGGVRLIDASNPKPLG